MQIIIENIEFNCLCGYQRIMTYNEVFIHIIHICNACRC